MKTRLFILITFMLLLNVAYTQTFKPYEFNIGSMKNYKKQAKKSLNEHEWLSFKVNEKHLGKGIALWVTSYDVTICYDKKNPVIFVNDSSRNFCFKLTDDRVEIIDLRANEISVFFKDKRDKDGDSWYKEIGLYSYLFNYMIHKWYYIIPMNKIKSTSIGFLLTSFEDVNINGKSYCKYTGHEGKRSVYNKETGKYDIPIDYMIVSFVNNSTGILDSVYVKGCTDYTASSETFYSFYDVSYEDRQAYIDSVFNLDNPQYAKCSRHDELNLPPSHIAYDYTQSQAVADSLKIMDFPLVNLNNDTTSISERNGWVLLNFWSFGCQPCLKNLQNYLHEKDSLGYRILENKGVEILAINYRSNNMGLIKEMGEKTGTTDIMYSAKGMNTLINIPYLGYYYLISPEKEIVYESYTLGDYSELLKAKQEYEKTHLNK